MRGCSARSRKPCATHRWQSPRRRAAPPRADPERFRSRPIPVSAELKLSSPATREFWEIPVLFEDEHLLAVNKPAGLLTSPDRYDPQRPNLMKLLHAGIAEGKPWAKARG